MCRRKKSKDTLREFAVMSYRIFFIYLKIPFGLTLGFFYPPCPTAAYGQEFSTYLPRDID